MSYMCPLCNGFDANRTFHCPTCSEVMVDSGRLMDYFDDYSAYLEIDGMKKVDGFPDDTSSHQCPHVLTCPTCGSEITQMISEFYIP